MKYIIGIDEVGRGSIAGPVTVAALALPRNFPARLRMDDLPDLPSATRRRAGVQAGGQFSRQTKLKDSKQLSAKQREQWLVFIKKHKLSFAVASNSPKTVDKINISRAANLAAGRALEKLTANYKIVNCKIYLDGRLFLIKSLNSKSHILNSRTIVKGDEKIPAIALASIAAKVHRDRLMVKWHEKIPAYGFHRHKGYGTREHFKAVRKYGPSEIHRLTFLRKYLKIG